MTRLNPTVVSLLVFVVVSLVAPCGMSRAEDVQKTAADLLDRARQLSDIRAPNAPGFHLSLTFSYIGKDLETLQGTYTEIRMSSAQWRRETAVGNFRRIEVGGPTRHWLLDSSNDFPEDAARVATIVEVLPAGTAKFDFESLTAPDPRTQCAVTKAVGEKRARHAFCFDKDSHVLVENISPQMVGQRAADFSCSFSAFRKFGNYWFPREISCFQEGHKKLEAKVVDLSAAPSPDSVMFTSPAGAVEMGSCSVIPVPPQAVTTPNPMPPMGMRDHPSTVDVWMVIDTKGHTQSLKISKSGGKQFDDSALFTLRSWHFKPATCKGEPMPMPITVEIRFWGNYR